MSDQRNPDSDGLRQPSIMYRLHCRAEFAEVKNDIHEVETRASLHLDRVEAESKTRFDRLEAQGAARSVAIAELHGVLRNGILKRIERLEARWWAVAGSMLFFAATTIVQIILTLKRGG